MKRFFKGIWNAIDATRRFTINLLFVLIVVALIALAFSSDEPEIADTTALVIAPEGQLVEQLTAWSFERNRPLLEAVRQDRSPERWEATTSAPFLFYYRQSPRSSMAFTIRAFFVDYL